MSSQYAIQSRPFNNERLPYSGRSLTANRKPNQSDWRSNQGYSGIGRYWRTDRPEPENTQALDPSTDERSSPRPCL